MKLSPLQKKLFLLLIFLEGFFVLLLEIIGTRFLGPYFGTTIFVWSSLITVTLGSLALGYWIGAKISSSSKNLVAIFYDALLAASLFGALIPFESRLLSLLDPLGIKLASLLGAFILFAPALTLLSIATTVGVAIYGQAGEEKQKEAPGMIFALSTLGSILGGLVTGFILIPTSPISITIIIASFALALITTIGSHIHGQKIMTGIIVLIIISALSYSIQNTKPNTLFHQIGFYGEVEVRELGSLGRCLLVDNIIQGCLGIGEPSSAVYETLITPAENITSKKPQLLFLGLGAGVGPALIKNTSSEVTVVDIDPVVIEAAQKHLGLNPNHITKAEDARTFLRTTEKQFDFIALDLFHGASLEPFALSYEMFKLTKQKLTDDGVLSINLPGKNFQESSLIDDITTTLLAVFPEVKELPVEKNLILFASEKSLGENLGKTAQIKGEIITDDHSWVEKAYAETAIKIISLSRNLR